MEMNVDEMLGKITEFIKDEANTETIIGDQFTLGEFSCVPVIKVGMGFGSGGGGGSDDKKMKGEGGGAGAGLGMEPIGFLVSRGDDISFLAAGKTKGLASVFEKVPDLIEKFIDKQDKETA